MTGRGILIAVILGVFASGPLAAKEPLGLIVYKAGEAYLTSGGKTRAAQANELVGRGDTLKTKSGKVTIQLKAGVVFAISNNTEVNIAKLDDKASAIKLKQGSVAGQVKSSKGYGFQIIAPTAVAGVRGTDVIVEADEKGDSKVMVENGTVDVSDEQGKEKQAVGDGEKVVCSTKGIQKGIMDAFEKQKFEIFKEFNRVKKMNLEMIIEQKRQNRELIQKQLQMP